MSLWLGALGQVPALMQLGRKSAIKNEDFNNK
jgi:hypothetical protein